MLNKYALVLFALFFLATSTFALVSNVPTSSDSFYSKIDHYYNFQSQVLDQIGGINGTATSLTYSSGLVGGAGNFDGVSSKVSIDGATTAYNTRVVSALIKTDSIVGTHYIYEFGVTGGCSPSSSSLSLIDSNVTSRVGCGTDVDTNIGVSTWYHVVERVDSSNITYLYVNGTLVGSGDVRDGETTSLGNDHIGIHTDGVLSPFDGLIDEVMIFNQDLNATELNDLLTFYEGTAPAINDGYLSNGEAPFLVQWDGNVVSNFVFTTLDQTDLNRVKAAGFNGISVDVRANFVWTSCTGNPAVDFNWSAYDDLVTWATANNLYINFQPVYDTTGYIATCIDNNNSYSRVSYHNNFPSTPAAATYTSLGKQISMWDNDLNNVLYYYLSNFSAHFADENNVFMYTSPANEGLSNGLIDNNLSIADANTYWQTVYLPSRYANIAALNTDWGTSFGAFTEVGIPTGFTNSKQAREYWIAKSRRAIQWYTLAARYLKENAPTKQITTVKLLPDYFYPNGSGYRAYTHGIDVNEYLATAEPYIDWVSIDPYPDQPTVRGQATTLDARYGIAKSLADLYNKPLFGGEIFQTVNGGDSETCDEQIFAQMLLQSLAYVGNDRNSGFRGMSLFSWKWSGVGGDAVQSNCLSIRDSNYESIVTQLAPYLKLVLQEKNLDYNNNLYYYDNTNINLAFSRQYQMYEQFFGWIDQTHRIKDYAAQYLFNGTVPNNYTDVIYANAIYDQNANKSSIYNWVKAGGKLITGMRSLDENETWYDEYGATYLPRSDFMNALFGNTLTGLFYNIVTPQDYNVAATKTILTDAANTKVFSCRTTLTCDAEGSTTTTGVVEAILSGGTSSRLIKNLFGSGVSLRFGFNLFDLISDNNQTTTTNQMFADVFDYTGISRRDSNMENIYGWNSDQIAVFNAFATTDYNFVFDGNTAYTLLFVDGNTITAQNTSSGWINLDFNSGQSILLIKGSDLTAPSTLITTNQITGETDTNISLTCDDDYTGCAYINFKIDSLDWNYYAVSGDTSINFLHSGAGQHTIQYFSTDASDNNENTNSHDFNTYGLIYFTTYDENTNAPTTGATLDWNGTVHTIVASSADINLQGVSAGTKTFKFNKTSYATRYYQVDLNEFSDVNVGFALIAQDRDTNTAFTLYEPDGTTLYDLTYLEVLDQDNNRTVGRYKTDASGAATFALHENDTNYLFNVDNNAYIYSPVALTILYPKNEETLAQITEYWRIDISTNMVKTYIDRGANETVYLLPNTSSAYSITIQDMNSHYTARTYSRGYPGNPLTDTLQPYLLDTNDASAIKFILYNEYNNPIEGMQVDVYKIIGGVRTLVSSVTSDATGTALFWLVAGDTYEIQMSFSGTTFYSTTNYVVTSTPVYFYLNIGSQTTFPIDLNQPRILFNVSTETIPNRITSLITTAYNVTEINITYYQYVSGSSGTRLTLDTNTGICTSTCVITRDINSLGIDTNKAFYLDVNVKAFDGTYRVSTHKFVWHYSGRTSGLMDAFLGVRADFGCSRDPAYPCAATTFISAVIALIAIGTIILRVGYFGSFAISILALIILGAFTYIGLFYWVLYLLLAIAVGLAHVNQIGRGDR